MMTQIFGVVRTILAFGAGILVSKGYIDEATGTALVGAIVTIGTAIWSVVEKKSATTAA